MANLWVKRILGWSLVVIALAALGLIVLRSNPETMQSFRLPDGNVMTFMGATYGKHHLMYTGKPYQRSLYKLLPASLKSWSGCRVQSFIASNTNSPVFWITETVDKPPTAGGLSVRLVDEFGCEYDAQGYYSGFVFGLNGGNSFYYQFDPGYPRGRVAGISFFDSTNRTLRLGEFFLPGSNVIALPESKEPPPPQTDGDMSFQLLSLVTGLKSGPGGYVRSNTGGMFTQARIRILKEGQAEAHWLPISVKITDARGKMARTGLSLWGRKEEDMVFNFEGVLDPAGAPFKLRFEFMQLTGYSAEQLLSFTNVPFPSATQTIPLQVQRECQGQQFILESINGSFVERPTNSLPMGEPYLLARMAPTNSLTHVRLFNVVDERGKTMWQKNYAATKTGEYYFGLQGSPNASSMDVTFVMHKSRFAEFEATPVVFSTNAIATR